MKLKRDYEKILQECLNIDPYFFVDVFVSLYGLQKLFARKPTALAMWRNGKIKL